MVTFPAMLKELELVKVLSTVKLPPTVVAVLNVVAALTSRLPPTDREAVVLLSVPSMVSAPPKAKFPVSLMVRVWPELIVISFEMVSVVPEAIANSAPADKLRELRVVLASIFNPLPLADVVVMATEPSVTAPFVCNSLLALSSVIALVLLKLPDPVKVKLVFPIKMAVPV